MKKELSLVVIIFILLSTNLGILLRQSVFFGKNMSETIKLLLVLDSIVIVLLVLAILFGKVEIII